MVIKLDAFVTSDQTHTELCKALKVSGFPESKLRLSLEKLDATCLGEPKITIMLKQIDKQVSGQTYTKIRFVANLKMYYISYVFKFFVKYFFYEVVFLF